MAKRPCDNFLDSYLKCRKCGNHLMCEEHKEMVKKIMNIKRCNPSKPGSCEDC